MQLMHIHFTICSELRQQIPSQKMNEWKKDLERKKNKNKMSANEEMKKKLKKENRKWEKDLFLGDKITNERQESFRPKFISSFFWQ